MNSIKEKVVEILKKCNDPELPIDLWNLGLIYDLNICQKGDNFDVSILMSLTTPGCTMGQYMMDDMKMQLTTLRNIGNIEISCLSCNLRRRTMHHERYILTKQIQTIKKMA